MKKTWQTYITASQGNVLIRCENYDLKSVVKIRIYSIHKVKNVFGIMF